MSRRTARILTGLVTLYFVLDFTAPSIPGAFTFDADESVEVRLARDAEDYRAAMVLQPESVVVARIDVVPSDHLARRPADMPLTIPASRCSLARAALARPSSDVG